MKCKLKYQIYITRWDKPEKKAFPMVNWCKGTRSESKARKGDCITFILQSNNQKLVIANIKPTECFVFVSPRANPIFSAYAKSNKDITIAKMDPKMNGLNYKCIYIYIYIYIYINGFSQLIISIIIKLIIIDHIMYTWNNSPSFSIF